MLLCFLSLSRWCTTNTLSSLQPHNLQTGLILFLIRSLLWCIFSPPFQFPWRGPLNSLFLHKVWWDLLQKNLLLFDCLNSWGCLQSFFPQISQYTNLPLNRALYWHLLEQYFPHPHFKWLGFAWNFFPQILQATIGINSSHYILNKK